MDDKDQLKLYLDDYMRSHLTASPAGGAEAYNCVFCSSGTGKNKSGALRLTPNKITYHCFSCGQSGDIFSLIGQVEGLPTFQEQEKRARELYAPSTLTALSSKPTYKEKIAPDRGKRQAETDHTAEFEKWNKDLDKTDYYRGISRATLDRFKVGYCESWRHPKKPRAEATPRLIIPTSPYSYIARLTREEDEGKGEHRVEKEGTMHLFNERALFEATTPIVIVEGEIDALSIIDAGGEAVGLGGTSGVNKLLDRFKVGARPKQKLIIALDNDQAGEQARDKLEEQLKGLRIDYRVVNLYGTSKDANEALQTDFKGLQERLASLVDMDKREFTENTSNSAFIDTFIADLNNRDKRRVYKTGLKCIDQVIDGGLHEGLTILGAMSSLGKTTLILQIADNLSKSGIDTLFFSLEMSRYELMSKSISRLTYKLDETPDKHLSKTVRGLYRGAFNADEVGVIKEALDEYRENIAPHLFVYEGVSNITARDIVETVKNHVKITGNTPVVFIDYLQVIMPPPELRLTEKQTVENTIRELKLLSRELSLPVITLSSFNRTSYSNSADMTSFKESGGIEYSSDFLLALQFEGMDEEGNKINIKEAKREIVRSVELVNLKDRNGQTGEKAKLLYQTRFNCFEAK